MQRLLQNKSANNYIKFCLISTPLVIIAILVAFWGIWNSYQAGDDARASQMIDYVNIGEPTLGVKFCRLFKATLSPIHWVPISAFILYPTQVDDSNRRIVVINLIVLAIGAILAGCLALTLGSGFLPSLICSIWIASSQVLVLALASCWGVMNILPSVFVMAQVLILWRWFKVSMNIENPTGIRWRFILGYLFFFMLAVLTKETGIRGLLLVMAVFSIAFFYRRDRRFFNEVILLFTLIAAWLILYFAARYFFTMADIPMLRSGSAQTDYHLPRLDLLRFIKNAAMLLIGSLNPSNSYKTYLNIVEGRNLNVFLRLLPAVIWGAILFIGWLAATFIHKGEKRFNQIFVALLVLCSLFPDALLGKVSEVYAMATLWPLAVLSAIVLTFVHTRNRWLSYPIVSIICLLIVSNLYAAQAKVREIVVTGQNAHGIRQSMIELTKDLPAGSKIAVIHKPRPKNVFARFGERGVQANGGLNFKGNYTLKNFTFDEPAPNLLNYDLILRENEEQTELEVVSTYDNKLKSNN